MKMEEILQLINTVSASGLTEFNYEENGIVIGMKKDQPQITVCEAVDVPKTIEKEIIQEKAPEKQEGNYVKSPLVGTFYVAPSEDSDPFVKVGDTVKKGQTLAIVEAMKLMNEIESEFDGVITEVLVENGQAVEYGQPLFCIK